MFNIRQLRNNYSCDIYYITIYAFTTITLTSAIRRSGTMHLKSSADFRNVCHQQISHFLSRNDIFAYPLYPLVIISDVRG